MAKAHSKKSVPAQAKPSENATASARNAKTSSTRPIKSTEPKPSKSKLLRKAKRQFKILQSRWREFRSDKVQPHKSFKRSYREDYARKTNTPGLLSHAITTFQIIFKHWKVFVPFILIMVIADIILVGLLSEDLYQQFQASIDDASAELAGGQIGNFAKAGLLLLSTITSGGLSTSMGDAQLVFMILIFLIMWLTTIYFMRHFMAGGKPKLRDALYNSLGPLISTFLVFVVIFIQAIPIMLVVITYSAATITGFLNTPFYALVYFIFAALMITITTYLLSSSLMALVAVTAPGMYPMRALFSASDLVMGRRIKLIIRVIYLIFVAAIVYAVTILPVILLDLWLKSMWEWIYGVPIVPCALLIVTCFVFIYATIYLYRYYRWLLDYQEK